jgi:hypothetical protein
MYAESINACAPVIPCTDQENHGARIAASNQQLRQTQNPSRDGYPETHRRASYTR